MAYPGDRRKKSDRRQISLGPPINMKERRQQEVRRATQIDEVELSDDQWMALFSKKSTKEDEKSLEEAAMILERAKD